MQLLIFEAVIEWSIAYWLIFFGVKLRHEGMLQCIFNCNSFAGVDLEHLTKQVYAFRWCIWELLAERNNFIIRKLAHESACLFGCNKVKVFVGKLSKLGRDKVKLMMSKTGQDEV